MSCPRVPQAEIEHVVTFTVSTIPWSAATFFTHNLAADALAISVMGV